MKCVVCCHGTSISLFVLYSQLPVSGGRDRQLPTITPLPPKVNLGLVFGEREEAFANLIIRAAASASEGSASFGEPEEDGARSQRSASPASSQCSATYSNLGKTDRRSRGFLKVDVKKHSGSALCLKWKMEMSSRKTDSVLKEMETFNTKPNLYSLFVQKQGRKRANKYFSPFS